MKSKTHASFPMYFITVVLCILLTGCDINISLPSGSSQQACQDNCSVGSGVQNVKVFVEPDAGEHPISDAIHAAKKAIWLEMYFLTDRNIIRALEEAANRGVDVRVMLELHPFGGGSSPTRTMDQLKAAGVNAQPSNPSFPLTHAKSMIIDDTAAYIMTSNFSRSALGGSNGSSLSNR